MKALKRIDQWLFGKVGPETLAMLRILLGTLIFLELCLFGVIYRNFFTDYGVTPMPVVERYLWYPSNILWEGTPLQRDMHFAPVRLTLFDLLPFDWWPPTLYVITILSAISFTLGFKTRISGIILVAGVITFHLRAVLFIHAGDTMLRLGLIYLAFSQCGRVYSLDWLLAKTKPVAGLVWAFPQRLIWLQTAICYFMTVWWKWHGNHWHDGTATWFPNHLREFTKFPIPDFMFRQPFVMITTYGTLLVELGLVFLVFDKKLRRWAVLAGLALHAYIEYAFAIPFFSAVICSTYVAFYEADEVKAFVDRMKTRFMTKKQPEMVEAAQT